MNFILLVIVRRTSVTESSVAADKYRFVDVWKGDYSVSSMQAVHDSEISFGSNYYLASCRKLSSLLYEGKSSKEFAEKPGYQPKSRNIILVINTSLIRFYIGLQPRKSIDL